MQVITDTVGFLPNVRKSDNLIQLLGAGVGLVLGTPIGAWLLTPLIDGAPLWVGALLGAGIGAIAGIFVSGFVIMIRGYIRTARNS